MIKRRKIKDVLFRYFAMIVAICALLLVCAIGAGLYYKSMPVLEGDTLLSLMMSNAWHPLKGDFGLFPFIAGTLWVTILAMIIAVPVSLLSALYISEYAGGLFRGFAKPMIDLLAGIPSVIYGVWGVLVIVPFVGDYIAPIFGIVSTGYTALSAGIVLAVMVFPVIIHILIEVFKSVPDGMRHAALSLGATRWQVAKHVVLRKSIQGIVASFALGLSRAFGETMAVLMVAGNVVAAPQSALDPAYPLPALLANNYGEMMSIPMYDSALMMAALVLFLVVTAFNLISRYVLSVISGKTV